MPEDPAQVNVPVVDKDDPNSDEAWMGRIDASIAYRREFLRTWRDNVAYRMQKPFLPNPEAAVSVSQDRFAVPEDWARTNQKIAQLMFAVPKIALKATHPAYVQQSRLFQAVINDQLKKVRASFMLDECLADVVNAAGIMASKIAYHATTEDVEIEIPQQPGLFDAALPLGAPPPPPQMETRTNIIDERYTWERLSPGSLLWPAEFSASDWDTSPWVGEESYMLVKEALKMFSALPRDFKPNTSKPELLSEDADLGVSRRAFQSEGYVKVRTVWYKLACFTSEPVHPDRLCRKVFVEGHPTAVVDEKTPWQVEVPQPNGSVKIVGITKYPIRVGTLRYVSDLAVPPSDSEAGRPQVRELIRSRSQMLRQRDQSIPMRWYDTNRVDPLVAESMQRGDWQGFIPMQGPGERAIGEVARAQYPRESFQFQNVLSADLDKAWSLSNNQMGLTNEQDRSASEINTVQSATQIRLDYERARVLRYIADGAEVLGGLLQLFVDDDQYVEMLGPEKTKILQAWNRRAIAGDFIFDYVPDSGQRIDATTRQQNLLKVFNLLGNSPSVARQKLEAEIFVAHGLDPDEFVSEPPPPQPEAPNISYRFAGEDLLRNPIAVALMLKTGVMLTPQDIEASKRMIIEAAGMVAPMPGAPGAEPAPQQQEPVEVPETPTPIAKRAIDGTHLV